MINSSKSLRRELKHIFVCFSFLDVALLEYFRSIFDQNDVLESYVALDLYGLEKHIENRDKVVQKLEVSFIQSVQRNLAILLGCSHH